MNQIKTAVKQAFDIVDSNMFEAVLTIDTIETQNISGKV